MTSSIANPAATAPLERLLKSEDNVSNLIAYLATLDPVPLANLLNIPAENLRVARETNLTGRKGRSDFIVWNGSVPRAIIELKVAASEHGDQLDRYARWALEQSSTGHQPVTCLLADLTAFNYRDSDVWEPITLSKIMQLWDSSSDDHARMLAGSMRAVFDSWVSQLSLPIGMATSSVVATLAVKTASTQLFDSPWRAKHSGLVRSSHFADSGGKAAMYHFVPFPDGPEHSWISLDIRAGDRNVPSCDWNFRLGVETDIMDRSLEEAQRDASDLATRIRPSLELESFRQFLIGLNEPNLANVLSAGGHSGTGLPAAGFRNDLGKRRLSSIFWLNVTCLSISQLVLLMQLAVDYLVSAAENASDVSD